MPTIEAEDDPKTLTLDAEAHREFIKSKALLEGLTGKRLTLSSALKIISLIAAQAITQDASIAQDAVALVHREKPNPKEE